MLDDASLDLLLREARTYTGWLGKPVSDEQLRQLYEITKWGPTSSNSAPLRILFLRTAAARKRLKPALSPTNVEKTMTAPVTAILAHDTRFYEFQPRLFPRNPRTGERFATDAALTDITALRNGTLQGGYLILAARAMGLYCGAMSGFDNAKVDAEFFPDGRLKSNFLCNLGYPDPATVLPRNPRLTFEEVCRML